MRHTIGTISLLLGLTMAITTYSETASAQFVVSTPDADVDIAAGTVAETAATAAGAASQVAKTAEVLKAIGGKADSIAISSEIKALPTSSPSYPQLMQQLQGNKGTASAVGTDILASDRLSMSADELDPAGDEPSLIKREHDSIDGLAGNAATSRADSLAVSESLPVLSKEVNLLPDLSSSVGATNQELLLLAKQENDLKIEVQNLTEAVLTAPKQNVEEEIERRDDIDATVKLLRFP
jgi:hypothetical protein